FDSHELFSEVPELYNRPRVKHFWKRLEHFLIPKIDIGITVCSPIAEFYQNEYGKNFHVILNVPFSQIVFPLEKNNTTDEIRIIYQGAVNKGRGLFLLVDSIKFIPNACLTICGIGDEIEALRQYINQKDYANRVHLMGKVAYEHLPQITRTAHVGVSLEEDLGLNYRFASPNKLFDYIQAQIPVVVSNLPVMSAIVTENRIGEVLYERTPETLANLIKKVAQDFKNGNYTNSLVSAASTFNWDVEKKKFLRIFASLEEKTL
ncbi:MAG TPA: glycosyltransferase, partial [Salinivirgaceae bacterium]|nr:glycosyltransferase [Salinivirgaceae bacterium]